MAVAKKALSGPRQRSGRRYEDAAAAHYERAGFEIVARNWRAGRCEVDLIVRNATSLRFVEVKGGKPENLGHPALRVDRAKQGRLIRAAQSYLLENPENIRDVFFDVVATIATARGYEIEIFENAFMAEDLP